MWAVGPVENLRPTDYTLLPSSVIHNMFFKSGLYQLYFQLNLKESISYSMDH